MDTSSPIQRANDMSISRAADGCCCLRPGCSTETNDASEVISEVQAETTVRCAHSAEPLIFEDDFFRCVVVNFSDPCILQRRCESPFFVDVRVTFECMALTDDPLMRFLKLERRGGTHTPICQLELTVLH